MASTKNAFLDTSASEQSDNEQGYDSEAAEQAKGRRSTERPSKRRKVSSDVESASGADEEREDEVEIHTTGKLASTTSKFHSTSSTAIDNWMTSPTEAAAPSSTTLPTEYPSKKKDEKEKKKKMKKTPGVIYLSSLPPYLRPSALRNLLLQRGFSPITRLFLSPASKPPRGSKSTKRQLYTEGWIEFASKTTARRCAETLNAAPVGGKKGGFYHDDVWNMKYLRGMAWEELMAGVREERREAEGRRDEERLVLARETKRFVQGVERGRRSKGIEEARRMKRMKKRERNGEEGGDDPKVEEAPEIKRTWRQFEVRRNSRKGPEESAGGGVRDGQVSDDVKKVLGKIF